jgi:8-oxo-dGTP pyrophosphatase MutT (NUDIX family)
MADKDPFPVPVVRLVIPDAEGRVLILRRQNCDYGEGLWCLPGGKVDYGDTVERTVAKELEEETSLECTESRFLFYQDSLPEASGLMHCINLYFECRVSGDIILNEESSEYAWIGRDELDSYEIIFRNKEALRRYWA